MNWRKRYFRDLMSSKLPIDKKMSGCKDLFKGRNGFIFAAGPSLKNVEIEKIPEFEDSLTICIKQSISIVGDSCDILLMNFCNFSAYDWDSILCPVFWTTFAADHPTLIKQKSKKHDALFEVIENGTNDWEGFSQSTAGKGAWQNLLEIDSGYTKWGPGLMYELAIPLAINCGIDHIYLVGWDIGTKDPDSENSFLNKHFYDHGSLEIKTNISNLEIEFVSKSTKSLHNWLNKRNIGLSVVSDKSLADEVIPRENKWLKESV